MTERKKEGERGGEGKEKKEEKTNEGKRKSELKMGKGYRTVLTKAVPMWPCTVCCPQLVSPRVKEETAAFI